MEEPFGINQLDLIMIVRLLDNGNISTSEADILSAKAFSCSSDCEFQVDKKEAIRILKSVVLPYIWATVTAIGDKLTEDIKVGDKVLWDRTKNQGQGHDGGDMVHQDWIALVEGTIKDSSMNKESSMKIVKVVVLSDGETFDVLKNCTIIDVPEEHTKTTEDIEEYLRDLKAQ